MVVELIDPESYYNPSLMNPVKSSLFECAGTIVSSCSNSRPIEVRWANGKINCYNERELVSVNNPINKNDITKYKSIW